MTRALQLQSASEVDNLVELLLETNHLGGDCAEVGVYRGECAEIIRQNTDKHLWLFDLFADFIVDGHDSPELGGIFFTGDRGEEVYAEVIEKFKDRNTDVIRGNFPESVGDKLENVKFSFVHIDVDVYTPTRKSLEFFYPKMVTGGVMLFHDYIHPSINIKETIDDFFSDKPEKIILGKPVSGEVMSQGYIIKQ